MTTLHGSIGCISDGLTSPRTHHGPLMACHSSNDATIKENQHASYHDLAPQFRRVSLCYLVSFSTPVISNRKRLAVTAATYTPSSPLQSPGPGWTCYIRALTFRGLPIFEVKKSYHKCLVFFAFYNKLIHQSTSLTMNLLPASNGPTAPPSAPRMQLAQIPGSSSYEPQPIPRDSHFNNLRHPDMFNNINAGSFPLSTFHALQGSRQGMDPRLSFLNDQAPSDVIWPGTNPTALPDGSSQYISSNQSFQAACTCPTCVAHRFTAEPVQFGGGQPAPAPAGQDAMTSSGPASSSSTSRRVSAAPLILPPALDASMHYLSTIDAGMIGFTQPTQLRAKV